MNLVPLTESIPSVRYMLLPAGFLVMATGLHFFSLLKYADQLKWYTRVVTHVPLLGILVVFFQQNGVQITVNQGLYWRMEQYNNSFTYLVSGIVLYSMIVLLVFLYTSYQKAVRSEKNDQQRYRIRLSLIGGSFT
ncbi:hypothetical protein [Paenibacillus hexagrammi]|uniref:Uncharacterized protein n=1 Tax=Paenibacillus hexagrammi TaxID=2908839 RepID=A0ABY3SE75_9BACL|nr:hypothetical protein [Paenibacillus sp. YPD9-1]UJF31770.1 hypothetical protein L0M14_18580 [Paenibacillus sp. YPD9-1]